MALINCSECGKEFSDKASACPQCGCPIDKMEFKTEPEIEEIKEPIADSESNGSSGKSSKRNTILIILGIVLLVVLAYSVTQSNSKQTNKRDTSVRQVSIKTDYINIRKKKNVTSDILGKVHKGEIYTIISEDANSNYHWIEIKTANGIHGYISGMEEYVNYLEIENSDETNSNESTNTNETTPNETNNNTEQTYYDNSGNNDTSYNNYDNNNNSYTPEPAPQVSYQITSIDGIGGTYNNKSYNECRVDDFSANVEEISLPNSLQINYSVTFTKTQRFSSGYDTYCWIKISAYDSNNIMVGSHDAFVDIDVNETGRQTFWFFIDKSGTDYSIRLSESK